MADRTVEQVVMPLALLEVRCLCDCHPVATGTEEQRLSRAHTQSSCPCQPTFTVAKFPMLRAPCKGNRGYGTADQGMISFLQAEHDSRCCGGRGWLPVTTTDALLEAGKSCGISLVWDWERTKWSAGYHGAKRNFREDMPQDALALALSAAKGIEVEK